MPMRVCHKIMFVIFHGWSSKSRQAGLDGVVTMVGVRQPTPDRWTKPADIEIVSQPYTLS